MNRLMSAVLWGLATMPAAAQDLPEAPIGLASEPAWPIELSDFLRGQAAGAPAVGGGFVVRLSEVTEFTEQEIVDRLREASPKFYALEDDGQRILKEARGLASNAKEAETFGTDAAYRKLKQSESSFHSEVLALRRRLETLNRQFEGLETLVPRRPMPDVERWAQDLEHPPARLYRRLHEALQALKAAEVNLTSGLALEIVRDCLHQLYDDPVTQDSLQMQSELLEHRVRSIKNKADGGRRFP